MKRPSVGDGLSPSRIIPDPGRVPARAYADAGFDRALKTHPAVPAALYGPLAAWLCWRSFLAPGFLGSTWLLFVGGLLLWSALEYGIHRGLLHFADIGAWWNMSLARIHARHHEHPEDVSQVIISPLQTAPLALLLYGALRLGLAAPQAGGVLAGIIAGYLCYESFHYAFHTPQAYRWSWLSALKKYHTRHHFDSPDRRFGVTTPLWDLVFGT